MNSDKEELRMMIEELRNLLVERDLEIKELKNELFMYDFNFEY